MLLEQSQQTPTTLHRSISHTPSMVVNIKEYLSDHSQFIDCPYCKVHNTTEVKFTVGLFTWISFLIILMVGVFILPLFFLWVPFLVDTFKDAHHYCSNCKAWIGIYRRLGKSK
ncbi:hypothetical protein LOAG_00475 [Loa loa]|uniref:LITAF domain-containing protein n=1 Tax=Loa loa TaxID=7209 RepID=A0A1S0UBL2_LOALO|nr:hypothetical protein LOAG_00475 [Loa loa]EFO27999.1 hypothetical protein LOAG_00475 [Loa loa]